MSRTLITGGAGFIGSHLVERRLAAGDTVVVLDSFNDFYDPAIKESNLAASLEHPRFHLVRGDLRSSEDLDEAFSGEEVDCVVHLAAMPGVRPSVQKPDLYYDVNCTGTVRLLEAAVRNAPKCKFVFGSSSSVYGASATVPFKEDDVGDRPISPYAASKRAGELQAYVHHHLYGMPVCCLRFFTVFGPRQRPEMAIHKFTRQIHTGEEVVVYGDGSALRDFTYITDILDGIERAMERCSGFQVYNLGESRTVSVKETIDRIAEALGKPATVRFDPPCEGDVPVTYADLGRARAELGYDPQVDVTDGIRSFVEWFLRHAESGDRVAP